MKFLKSIKNGFVKGWKKVSTFFANGFNKFKSSKLTTLVLMQLKDKWNFSFKTNKKASIFKIITYIVLFAIICGVSYMVMNVLVSKLNVFVSQFFPVGAINVIIVFLTVLEALSILIGETNALYFSRDNTVLITYPVKSDYLFFSKIIVYLFDALKKAFSLFVPVLFAYGLVNKLPIGFFFWMPFAVILFVILLVAVCSLLTVPTYYIMRLLKKFKIIKIIFTLAVLGGVVYLAILVVGVIPGNINLIRTFEKFSMDLNNFLNNFRNSLKGMYYLTTTLCGESRGYLYTLFTPTTGYVILTIIGGTILFVLLVLFVSKPFYIKMISARNNFETKPSTSKNNKRTGKFRSILKYEILRIIRDEKNMIYTLIAIVITPIFMLIVGKFYSALSTRYIGDVMIIFFNLLIILIFTFTYNIKMSCVISKDGPSWNINKTMPVDPRVSLPARLIYNIVTSMFVYVPATIIFYNIGKITTIQCIAMVALCFVLSTTHILLSASYDLMNSKDKTKADIGSEYISKHETVSLAYGLIMAVATAGIGLIMGLTSTLHIFARLLALAIVFFVIEIYLFFKRIRAVYQEN